MSLPLAKFQGEPLPDHLKLTVEDFELFPDDGQRHELIDGEHYVTQGARDLPLL